MPEKRVECPSCGRIVTSGTWCPLCGAAMGEFAWLAGLATETPPAPVPEAGVSGWYPAAEAPGRQRYWDGYRWTDRFRQAPAAPTESPPAPVPDEEQEVVAEARLDPVEQLERLAKLRHADAITEAEFEAAKKRLLDRL